MKFITFCLIAFISFESYKQETNTISAKLEVEETIPNIVFI